MNDIVINEFTNLLRMYEFRIEVGAGPCARPDIRPRVGL